LRRRKKNTRTKVKRKPKANLAKQLSSTAPPGNGSREAVRDILNRLFGDSAESLVKSLADSNQLTPEEAARMNEIFGKGAKHKKRKR
jgi:predicted transcriptional regulator